MTLCYAQGSDSSKENAELRAFSEADRGAMEAMEDVWNMSGGLNISPTSRAQRTIDCTYRQSHLSQFR